MRPRPKWQVVFYETRTGRKPVREFLDALPVPDQVSVARNIELLVEFGLDVGAPTVKRVTDRPKLWELRVKATSGTIRIFYFAQTGRCFVLLHGIVKKARKTPAKELDIAEKRMFDVLERDQ